MKNNIAKLKKPAAMIHITGNLSLIERKLANVLLLNAYDDLLTTEEFKIPVATLIKMLGWGVGSNNLQHLRDALESLQKTIIQFDRLSKRGKLVWLNIQLIGRFKIESGVCTYTYDSELKKRMANPEEAFGMIDIDIQNRFASSHALALYENCVRFKRVGSTGFHGVQLWRELLGADSPAFEEFKRFSGKVVNPSIKQVNQVSDIEITAEYLRENRKTTAIRYSVKDKAQQSIEFFEPVEREAARTTELCKRLVDHGIAEKLAIDWIIANPERALSAVDHVEMLEKVKPLNNSAGYIRRLIESDSAIGESPIKKRQKATAQENTIKPEKEFTKAVTKAVKALPIEEVRTLAAIYMAADGAASANKWDEEKARFKTASERIIFTTWLHANAPQVR